MYSLESLISLLTMSQDELACKVKKTILKSKWSYTSANNAYIYANFDPNKPKPVLVSHLDVYKDKVPSKREIIVINEIIALKPESKKVLGGDDRCGVWIMIKLIEEGYTDFAYLFCYDEEKGCCGSRQFNLDDGFTCVIGLDRRGTGEFAFYKGHNRAFYKLFIDLGLAPVEGSRSDCAIVSDKMGIASINLAIGFYQEHTSDEYIVFPQTVKVLNLLKNKSLTEKLSNNFFFTESSFPDIL